MCANSECTIKKPKRPQTRCDRCKAYYHLDCFFDTHVAGLRGHVERDEDGEEDGEEDEEESEDGEGDADDEEAGACSDNDEGSE